MTPAMTEALVKLIEENIDTIKRTIKRLQDAHLGHSELDDILTANIMMLKLLKGS